MIDCHDVLFFAMPQTKSKSLADLLFTTYIQKFCPAIQKHLLTIALFFDGSPQPPRRPRRIPGARGQTPLHYAARFGRAAVVERLISAGATVDAVDEDGRGPGRVFRSFLGWL